jgi:4-hydroxy-tetrahydrodipicolinate synthase
MKLKGVLPVLQLPYDEDYSIDFATLQKEIAWVFKAGAEGAVLGMASEILRLTDGERDRLVRQVVKFTAGRGPVIASVGAESIPQAVRNATAAQEAGAAALMALPPALTHCADDEIVRYYGALLEATTLSVIVQDAAGFVGSSLSVALQASLYRLNPDRIMFKPEAQPVGATISALRDATGGKGTIFDGRGGMTLMDNYRRGIAGTMPGSDLPWAIVALWRALERGEESRARQIQGPLAALTSMLHNVDAFLAAEKLLLITQGIFKNTLVRGPVGSKLDPETEKEIIRIFEYLKEVVG